MVLEDVHWAETPMLDLADAVVQLTAMLADQGLLANGRWVGSGGAHIEIPMTLQALLAARLD